MIPSFLELEYLNGFKCSEFEIKDKYYMNYNTGKLSLINNISGFENLGIVFYVSDDKPFKSLIYKLTPDKEIIDNILSYYKYNKRKQIIESI